LLYSAYVTLYWNTRTDVDASTRLFYATYNYASVQDEEWLAPKTQRRSAKSAEGQGRSSSSSSNSRRGSNSNKQKSASGTSPISSSENDQVHTLLIVTPVQFVFM
jgi:hypothetical protein